MKKNNFLVLVGFLLATISFAQVPAGYKLIKGESPAGRDDYYTNGRIKIFYSTVQEFGDGGAAEWIEYFYEGFKIMSTKDGLVVGTGNSRGTNMYIVFKEQVYYIVSTKLNYSKEFSDMSKFVLKKVRASGNSFLEQ